MESRSRSADPEQLLAHGAWARRLAHSLVGEAAAADDLVQETWRAALERPPDDDRPLRPWLARVLTNFARQRARGAGRRGERERTASRDESLPGPDELVERLDSQRALTEELAALSEPLRSTVLLRYFEDLEPSEIARRQGLPAGTVRWRLKRGLDELRERLDRRFGDRRRWALLLVPLARPVAPVPVGALPTAEAASAASPTVVTSGGTGAALAGVWIVGTTSKLIAASAAVAVAYLGLAWTGVLPASVSLWPKEAPAQVGFRPLVEVQQPAELAPEAASSPAIAQRSVATATPAPVAEPVAALATDDGVVLSAGVFDMAGVPLAGGHLRLVSPRDELSRPSDRDGALRMELEYEGLQNKLNVLVERRGYASQLAALRVQRGERVQLGNFRLELGGAISGRVVDADGRGLGDILVTIGSPGDDPGELDWKRYAFYSEEAARTRTRPDGTFLLGGVHEGFARVWASGSDWLASFSAPVEVRAGQESTGLELVLDELSDAFQVRGRVLAPDNSPVPHADLDYRKQSRNRTMSGSVEADEQGHFRFVLPPGMTLSLVASDPQGELGAASVQDLVGGAPEQVLRLTALRRVQLLVSDAAGEALERFAFRVISAADESYLSDSDTADHPGGLVDFSLPSQPFLLVASAPGHSEERLGPLNPISVADSVQIALAPLPGVRGRVLVDGQPHAGAQVSLHQTVDPDRYIEHNGFEVDVEPNVFDSTQSDGSGRFLLTPRKHGKYVVRAESRGFAPSVVGPFDVDPFAAGAELVLELKAGGAIEGRVLTPPGPDASGRIVGISRGDAHAVTQRTGADGSFRFEHLTPGPWQVRLVDSEIYAGESSSMSTNRRKPQELKFDCRVEEGRTTRYDIDASGGDACRLSGVLQFNGGVPGAWTASLTEGPLFGGKPLAEGELGVDGQFELVAPAPGTYQLMLMGSIGEQGLQALIAQVEVGKGTTSWSQDIRTGTLTVENVPASSGADPRHVYLWFGPGDVLCLTALVPDENGVCELPRVPLGPGRVVDLGNQSRPITDPRDWPSLLDCNVRFGETNRVTLP